MRHTGGRLVGDISTKSRLASRALDKASFTGRMPICSPFSPINRTGDAMIR
jgi:hypothetical protein